MASPGIPSPPQRDRTFPDRSEFVWQRGYAAFGVSKSNVSAVVRYIETLKAHHTKVSFEEELSDSCDDMTS